MTSDKEARELNEAVARKLGWFKQSDGGWSKCHEVGGEVAMLGSPDYVGDIKAAWEIVEHLRDRSRYAFEIHSMPNGYAVVISGPTWKQAIHQEADTAPEAIVRAFLKLP